MPSPRQRRVAAILVSRGPRLALVVILLLAAAQYGWNAWTVAPLSGYDAGGHAGYVLTVVEDGRLPHPLEGWSTFHPPLYYLLGLASVHDLGDHR